MAFRFKESEKVSKGVRRLVTKQLDKSLQQLMRPPASAEDAVHDARVCFKKIRAILRLSRGALPTGLFKKYDRRFRDLGQQLSQVRDQDASVETFDKLLECFHNQLGPKAFASVRSLLVRSKRPLTEQKKVLAGLQRNVRALRRDLQSLSLKAEKFAALRPGLKQLYQQGQRRLETANATRHVDDLHQWRKEVKNMMYAQTALSPVWEGMVNKLREEFDQLGTYLSDDHDLAMLRETVTKLGVDQQKDATEIEALLALIDRRRTELETEAEFLGRLLYAEKPKAFVGRFETYWNCWQAKRKVGSAALAGSPDTRPNPQ